MFPFFSPDLEMFRTCIVRHREASLWDYLGEDRIRWGQNSCHRVGVGSKVKGRKMSKTHGDRKEGDTNMYEGKMTLEWVRDSVKVAAEGSVGWALQVKKGWKNSHSLAQIFRKFWVLKRAVFKRASKDFNFPLQTLFTFCWGVLE